MRRLWLFIKFWLPPILWMAMIFFASSDSASSGRSSRILAPLFRWLFPSMSGDGIELCVHLARKMAHFTEFAFCAILLWRALARHTPSNRKPWFPRHAWLAFGISAAYAATDEIHQCFVPGRQGAIGDVLLDSLGAACGLLALWAAGRWSRLW